MTIMIKSLAFESLPLSRLSCRQSMKPGPQCGQASQPRRLNLNSAEPCQCLLQACLGFTPLGPISQPELGAAG